MPSMVFSHIYILDCKFVNTRENLIFANIRNWLPHEFKVLTNIDNTYLK